MRGVQKPEKRRAIFDFYRVNSDMLILQETHSSPECEDIWKAEWGGEVLFSHGTSAARGIAIFLKKGMEKQIKNVYKDELGRLIIFEYHEDETVIVFAAVYAPNENTPNFFRLVRDQLRTRSEKKVVI